MTPELTQISRLTLPAMIAVRANLDDRSLTEDLGRAATTPVPGPLRVSYGAEVSIAWMAPDELLVFCPEARKETLIASLLGASDGADVLFTDVSDMRVGFELKGGPLREVLARVTPADVSHGALPVGMVRRTRIGQIAAAFWLTAEDRAEVICFRSLGDYAFDVLRNAAAFAEPLGLYHATN